VLARIAGAVATLGQHKCLTILFADGEPTRAAGIHAPSLCDHQLSYLLAIHDLAASPLGSCDR